MRSVGAESYGGCLIGIAIEGKPDKSVHMSVPQPHASKPVVVGVEGVLAGGREPRAIRAGSDITKVIHAVDVRAETLRGRVKRSSPIVCLSD